MADAEPRAIGFSKFGGLRLDQSLDEVGAEASIYEHDVERDGTVGNIRSRDGFQKLNASAASGEYKGLYPHSALRLLAVKRVKSTEAKIVALNKEGTEVTSAAWPEQEVPSTFATIGNPTGTFTYMRAFTPTAPTTRFDGATFAEALATIENVNKETGEAETPLTNKAMPLFRHIAGWPDASNVLAFANTSGSTGGPNGAASSNSHVWFSKPGTGQSFDQTSFIALGVGDGEEITGMCVYAAQLYVFKETRFWVVSPPSTNEHGQPVFSFREVSLGQGTRIKQVLTEKLKETSDNICWASQDGVFFCTSDGIYQTNGSQPSKLSEQLKPLEETVPFEGPMAEFLNGSTESFRWPATGITILGRKIFVKRYEFMFVYDINVGVWTCWKMPSVSMAIWTGLTGGGSEIAGSTAPTLANKTGVGTKAWTVAGTTAEVAMTANTESNYVSMLNWGLAVPTGSTIVGVELEWQRVASTFAPPLEDAAVELVIGGTVKTEVNRKSPVTWVSFPKPITYGGPEDLWGQALTPTNVNAATFGVVLNVKNLSGSTTAHISAPRISVYYQNAEQANGGVRPRLFCSQTKTVFWNGPNAEEQATFPGWAWQSGLYDLGSQDPKELVNSNLWGAGTINVGVSKDFGPIEARHTFELGESTTHKMQNISAEATLHSHRFSGTGKASIQRFVRYLRTTATAGSQFGKS